ncbi:MAG: hypothetical protein AMXMBFR34_33090 [Myxococcaceae bacterium]
MTPRPPRGMMPGVGARLAVILCALAVAGCSSQGDVPASVKLLPLEPLKLNDPVGTYREVTEPAELRRAHAPYWEKLEKDATVRVGDWVRTGPAGGAQLAFANGAKLEVDERALVVVELPAEQPKDEAPAPAVAVSQGAVRGVAGDEASQTPPAPVLLRAGGKTQRLVAQAGQKKVGFRVRATERGTEIAVTEGSATVEQEGKSVALSAGTATVATETLSAPEEVPDFPVSVAPGIDARAVYPLRTPLFLTWKAVPKAAGYRVQVARDLNFSVDVKSLDVTGTRYEVEPDGRGLVVWRVATKAASGMLSEYGFARRIYFEAEAPRELLLTPESGETVGYATRPPTITFQWQAAAGAASYRLSVSKSGDPLRAPVVQETTAEQRVDVSKLGAGEYTWGVYVRPGMTPIFLEPRKLTVKLMPKPRVQAPNAIKWQ